MDRNKHNIGEKVMVTVTSVTKYGAFVKLNDDETGLIHISEISDSYIVDIDTILKVNTMVEALIIGDGLKPHTYKLSLKKISRRTRQKTAVNKPLTRKEFNKEKINAIPFEPVKNALQKQIEDEYKKFKKGE